MVLGYLRFWKLHRIPEAAWTKRFGWYNFFFLSRKEIDFFLLSSSIFPAFFLIFPAFFIFKWLDYEISPSELFLIRAWMCLVSPWGSYLKNNLYSFFQSLKFPLLNVPLAYQLHLRNKLIFIQLWKYMRVLVVNDVFMYVEFAPLKSELWTNSILLFFPNICLLSESHHVVSDNSPVCWFLSMFS